MPVAQDVQFDRQSRGEQKGQKARLRDIRLICYLAFVKNVMLRFQGAGARGSRRYRDGRAAIH